MGRCYEFGVSIDAGSEQAMVVAPEGGYCHCPATGVVCRGRFVGCSSIVSQPGRVPPTAPTWSLPNSSDPSNVGLGAAVALQRNGQATAQPGAASATTEPAPSVTAAGSASLPDSTPTPAAEAPMSENNAELAILRHTVATLQRELDSTRDQQRDQRLDALERHLERMTQPAAQPINTVAPAPQTPVQESPASPPASPEAQPSEPAMQQHPAEMAEASVEIQPAVRRRAPKSQPAAKADGATRPASVAASSEPTHTTEAAAEIAAKGEQRLVSEVHRTAEAVRDVQRQLSESDDSTAINAVSNLHKVVEHLARMVVLHREEVEQTADEHRALLQNLRRQVVELRTSVDHAQQHPLMDQLAQDMRSLREDMTALRAKTSSDIVTASQLAETINTLRASDVDEITAAHLAHAFQLEIRTLREELHEAFSGSTGNPVRDHESLHEDRSRQV